MNNSKMMLRHAQLPKLLAQDPFLTDEQLAKTLGVSIQTIRLDRTRLGIPEVRERVRLMAESAQNKLKAIDKKDIIGELIDLELGKVAVSTLLVTQDMVLEKAGVLHGYFMYAMADTLSLALVDAEHALTGVANVKYKVPVRAGSKLVARAEVANKRGPRYFIHVFIRSNNVEVFRAKFTIVALDDQVKELEKA